MQTSLPCIPCFVRQAADAVESSVEDPSRRSEILQRILHALADCDWLTSPPACAQRLHRIIRNETGDPDPYRAVKECGNRLALEGLPRWRKIIAEAPDSREAIVRLAAWGNLMDAAAKTGFTPDDLSAWAACLWTRPLAGHPHDLFRLAKKASRILYLADNAGEIVFDRLLVEALPTQKITVAVRGAPVLNDALIEDAEQAGLTNLVTLIDNGSDAPGTLLDDCSEVFKEEFRNADLVISKGQGNFETLSDVPAPIVFLFTVKCPTVAASSGLCVGTLVARRTDAWPKSKARRSREGRPARCPTKSANPASP